VTGLQHDALVFQRIFDDAAELDLTYAARRVLAMSATLFYRRGAAATSIRDITRECGLTPGALYKHFASKDDLLYALVLHGHARVEARLDTALDGVPEEPPAQLAAYIRAYVVGHLESPELAQLVRREYLYLSPERFEDIVRRRRGIRDRLAVLLRRGEQDGAFTLLDGDDRAVRTAVMLLDMCSRTSDWYDPGRAGTPVDELAERYVQAALRLAGAQHASTSR
jgi:TetR/AcrR family transcriptional regulator, cholesterol catabolism regulator